MRGCSNLTSVACCGSPAGSCWWTPRRSGCRCTDGTPRVFASAASREDLLRLQFRDFLKNNLPAGKLFGWEGSYHRYDKKARGPGGTQGWGGARAGWLTRGHGAPGSCGSEGSSCRGRSASNAGIWLAGRIPGNAQFNKSLLRWNIWSKTSLRENRNFSLSSPSLDTILDTIIRNMLQCLQEKYWKNAQFHESGKKVCLSGFGKGQQWKGRRVCSDLLFLSL